VSIFKFVKGFLANMLVIITWQLYCNLAQIWFEFAIKKYFFLIEKSSFEIFKIFQNPLT